MEQIKKADFKDMAPNLFCKTSSSLAGDYSQIKKHWQAFPKHSNVLPIHTHTLRSPRHAYHFHKYRFGGIITRFFIFICNLF